MTEQVQLHPPIFLVVGRRSAVIGIAVAPSPLSLPPAEGLAARYLLDQITADQTRRGSGLRNEALGTQVDCRDDTLHRAPVPDVLGEGARINPLNPHDSTFLEIRFERLGLSVIAGIGGTFLDNKSFHKGASGLDVLGIDPVVADEGIGHADDLPLVRGIGEDLLIAGHGRIEDHLTDTFALRTEGAPLKDGSIR